MLPITVHDAKASSTVLQLREIPHRKSQELFRGLSIWAIAVRLIGRTLNMYYLLLNSQRTTPDAGQETHCPETAKSSRQFGMRRTCLTAIALHPLPTDASSSQRGRRLLVTDGPFVETREVLGG